MNHMNQRRSYQDEDAHERRQFRHAYVMKGNFDYKTLKPLCEKIVFATDGIGDHVDNIKDQLEESLSNFDPDKDVLVPVGSAMINAIAGVILQKKLSEKMKSPGITSFVMGIWSEGQYKFWRFSSGEETDSYEIIQ